MTTNPLPLVNRVSFFFRRFGFWILLAAFLSLAWIIPSALTVLATNRNDVTEWLPSGHKETVDLVWFIERFGSDEILVASWPGCTLEDPRLEQLVVELKQATAASVRAKLVPSAENTSSPIEPASANAAVSNSANASRANTSHEIISDEISDLAGEAGIISDETPASDIPTTENSTTEKLPLDDQPLFKKIFHGPDVAAQILEVLSPADGPDTEEEAAQLDAEVRRRMSGWLLSEDGQTTCAVALISKAGEADRHAAVRAVYQAAEKVGVPENELRVGGPTGDSVAIDIASGESLMAMTGLACVVSMGLAWVALRRFTLVLVVFGTAFYCELLSLAIMNIVGQSMNSVLIMVPTLIYVLSVSGSIHLVNYYLDACRRGDRDQAVGLMFVESLAPCILAALTTAIGVGSLAMSDLVPIKKFGIFSAVNTMLSLGFLYILLPAALTFFHARKSPKADGQRTPEERGAMRRSWGKSAARGWAHFVVRANVPIVLLGVMSLTLFGLGVMEVQTAVKLKSLFDPRAKVVQNYAWLEEHLGPLVPVEIVLRFPLDGASSPVERLQLTAEVQRRLADIPGVGGTLSTATFSPQVPDETGARATAIRTQLNRILVRRRDEVKATGYLADAAGEDLWRISARVPAMSDEDYGEYLEQMRGAIEQTLASPNYPAATEATWVTSGGVPLFSSASKVLLSDLQSSFMSAFVLIGLAMFVLVFLAMAKVWPGQGISRWWSVLWRSTLGAVLAMIPNVFPILLVFGTMGAFNVKVDIGAMMTASVALGIAVDDTLHFLTWFQRGMLVTNSRRRAVLSAFRHCAVAMIQTSMVCSLGLLAFAPSEFIPISRFAWLMCALLFAALLGDMLILPALLTSSLGSVFGGRASLDEEAILSR